MGRLTVAFLKECLVLGHWIAVRISLILLGAALSTKDARLYSLVRTQALKVGIDASVQEFLDLGVITDDQAERFRMTYKRGVDRVGRGGPVMKNPLNEWYPGAQEDDPSWAFFTEKMIGKGKGYQLPSAHESSDIIVGLTPDPKKSPHAAKGLVVGFVQSGKTTNFTAVAAKIADLDYRMVIVFAGIHNALRFQTQQRLEEYLIPDDSGRWMPLTSLDNDFDLVKLNEEKRVKQLNAASLLRSPGKTILLVVKKNWVVLTKLLDWLSTDAAKEALKEENILLIDDEADQASVATETINPLIRNILALMPKSTYIGYTATPFANVFIDPKNNEDLYPRDFIYPLPRPDGYFGPEKLFGRDVLDGSDDVEGYDMIREIPEEDEFKYRPTSKDDEKGFRPQVTKELRAAISWFFLATSARWLREGPVDSSMLIHTSLKIEVHEAYKEVIENERSLLLEKIISRDEKTLVSLRDQWEKETTEVPASDWNRTAESFDELLTALPNVIEDCRVIIDNSKSEERLEYDERDYNTIIAVGGNTLSRGITLEGLVSSIFLRPTSTYDTLLQMGRWFGFRPGYEDLPRIWTTDLLRRSFRHLSLVEHEMRMDMQLYEMEDLTPTDAAVRIRTHPALRVTAKMGAAQPAETSYSGARVQVRQYLRAEADIETLEKNWRAGEELVRKSKEYSSPEILDKNGSVLYRNVDVSEIIKFLEMYEIHPGQEDVNSELILKYIADRNDAHQPQLTEWNVAVRAGDMTERIVFSDHSVSGVNRAPIADGKIDGENVVGTVADIGTLMVPQDLVLDVPRISASEARAKKEAGMKRLRNQTEEVKEKGLVVLYPISQNSKPTTPRSAQIRARLNAGHHILGLGLVFPRANASDSEHDSVQSTHVAVDLNPTAEKTNTEEVIHGEEA